MSNLANTEVLDSCPQCNGPIILLQDEWICSICGLRLLRWFDPERPLAERAKEFHMKLRKVIEESEGSKGSEPDASAFLEVPSPSSTGSSEPLKPSEHENEVPEDPDEKGKALRSYDCTRLGPLAPPSFMLMNSTRLSQLMKGNCSPDEAPGEQRFSHGRPTSAPSFSSSSSAGCFPEAQEKLYKFYDETTRVCKADGTAWCANPAAPVCWTRIDQERREKL